jgi:hypothetical protein
MFLVLPDVIACIHGLGCKPVKYNLVCIATFVITFTFVMYMMLFVQPASP